MINCNDNESDNDKVDHITKVNIDQQVVGIETNTENIACLGKIISLCNKQYCSIVWGSIY